jgi:hypothetical protein
MACGRAPGESCALGPLPHVLVVEGVLAWLGGRELVRVGAVSKALRLLAGDEELWQYLCLREGPGLSVLEAGALCRGGWRATWLLRRLSPRACEQLSLSGAAEELVPRGFSSAYLSDRWHRRFGQVPGAAQVGSSSSSSSSSALVPRVALSQLDPELFRLAFAAPRRPCVVAGAAEAWPARRWSLDALVRRCAPQGDSLRWRLSHTLDDARLGLAKPELSMAQFAAYLRAQRDESPLYLFDAAFGSKLPALLDEYDASVGGLFAEDLLAALGPARRPDFRWLLVGGARSGAPWHVDPSGTSAWNALLQGRKRWALYPPGVVPPAPRGALSSLRWFLDVLPHLPPHRRPLELEQRPGEVVFVPAGWWHCVLNLDETVSVTHNFADRSCLHSAVRAAAGEGTLNAWLCRIAVARPDASRSLQHAALHMHGASGGGGGGGGGGGDDDDDDVGDDEPSRAAHPKVAAFAAAAVFLGAPEDCSDHLDRILATLGPRARSRSAATREQARHSPSHFSALRRGSSPAFLHGPSQLVIKLYAPLPTPFAGETSTPELDGAHSKRCEQLMLSALASASRAEAGVRFPKLVGHGKYFGRGHESAWSWPYVVTERLKGEPLSELWQRPGHAARPGTSAVALAVARQLGCALRQTHALSSASSAPGALLSLLRDARPVRFDEWVCRQRLFAPGAIVASMACSDVVSADLLAAAQPFVDAQLGACAQRLSTGLVPLHGDLQADNVLVAPAPGQHGAEAEPARALLERAWGLRAGARDPPLERLVDKLVETDMLRLDSLRAMSDRDMEAAGISLGPRLLLRRALQAEAAGTGTGTRTARARCDLRPDLELPMLPPPHTHLHQHLAALHLSAPAVQVAVIDFGDAMLGDPLWDLVSLHVSALQCDKTLLARALEAYHGCALGTLTHIMGLPRARFAELMMCYTMLHPCRALEQALGRAPRLGVCASWHHVAAELWGLA